MIYDPFVYIAYTEAIYEKRDDIITNPRTPYPWINYLGNEEFCSIITNTAGAYSFYKDARLRRIRERAIIFIWVSFKE